LICSFRVRSIEVTESNEDHGAELKALAALHGEDVGRKCPVVAFGYAGQA
jgi:hypothetical protein